MGTQGLKGDQGVPGKTGIPGSPGSVGLRGSPGPAVRNKFTKKPIHRYYFILAKAWQILLE